MPRAGAGPAGELRMSPFDAGFRLVLELVGVAGIGLLGWELGGGGALGTALAVTLPLAAGVVWGRFRVDGDPGPAPVPVPGPVRLAIELDVFAAAVVGVGWAWSVPMAVALAVAVVVHYATTRDRMRWLLAQRPQRGPA